MPKRSQRKGKRRSPGIQSRGRTLMSGSYRYPAPISLPLKRKFLIQFRNVLTATSTGGGILPGLIPCDPSATLSSTFSGVSLFPEWTNVSALYGSVRCKQLEIFMTPTTVNETKGDVTGTLVTGSLLQNAVQPGSFGVVADNTDSQTWDPLTDTSGRGRYHALQHDWKSLTFAATATPAPSGTIYAGCPGGIQIYGATFPISTVIMFIKVVGTYQVMTRV